MTLWICKNVRSSVANVWSLRIFSASNRAVVQLGRTLEWGSRGRGFESRRPERIRSLHDLAVDQQENFQFFFFRKIGCSKESGESSERLNLPQCKLRWVPPIFDHATLEGVQG